MNILQANTAPSLPAGFRHENHSSIGHLEVATLFRQVAMGYDTEDDYLQTRQGMVASIGAAALDIGVRDAADELVGFASLVYKEAHGELTDLVVSPAHHGKGIGRALIARRLKAAEELGLHSLFICDLAPSNTLRSYYIEQGFWQKPDGDLTRGPEPIALCDLVE